MCARGVNHRNGLYDRLFAFLLDRFNARYEPLVADRKSSLFAPLAGDILEIGSGTGVNLRFLPSGVHWRGIDPNPHVEPYLRRESERRGVPVEFHVGTAEALPMANGSMDAVIGTLVLCSIARPDLALAEILRVLKPGGRFVFLEHVAAPAGTRTRRRQDWLTPFWKRLADGCRPNRETVADISAAGFGKVECEEFRLNLPIAGPHIAGVAVK